MSKLVDLQKMRHGTELLKRGFAKMQEGGVIMDVVTPEQAHIAEDAGATAVMALERVPADIRADGGVARMSHPNLIRGIIETTSIPVMAKARIGHDEEARVLQTLGVDMVDESEVLTPADPFYHIAKNNFTIPFVCGCTNLGEACRRIMEGAAMIRTKGEAGTGNVVSAIQHARLVAEEIALLQSVDGWVRGHRTYDIRRLPRNRVGERARHSSSEHAFRKYGCLSRLDCRDYGRGERNESVASGNILGRWDCDSNGRRSANEAGDGWGVRRIGYFQV